MEQFKLILLLLLVTSCDCELNGNDCPNLRTPLSSLRKRRHLNFPDGSNFVMTISLVKAFLTHVPSGWNTVIEIDTQFPLPNANFSSSHRRKLHHKQKRDYWERMAQALDFHNINGKACVLRGICEAKKHLAPPGKSLVHDLLRAIFTAPLHEEDFSNEISSSFEELLDPDICDQPIDCPISILDFLLALNRQK